MVKWENDKNVYILGAALEYLNPSIGNEVAEAVIAGWPEILGETPTLRAVKDQIKKLSTTSSSTGTKKPKAKTAAKSKGKGKAKQAKKRTRNDEYSEVNDGEAREEEEDDKEDDEQGPAKKQKVVVKQEEGDEDDEGE
ncbi:unnamed protein product, partial [Aureobasidium vineae]